jgi:hypothetical protein
MRIAVLLFALCCVPSMAAAQSAMPSASPAAASVAPSDEDVRMRAKDWLHMVQIGKIDRTQLTPKADAAFTDDVVAKVAAQLGPLGDPMSFTLLKKTNERGLAIYDYSIVFDSATLDEEFVLDSTGKVAGLRFDPAGSLL